MNMRRNTHLLTKGGNHSGDDCAAMQTAIEKALQGLTQTKQGHQSSGLYLVPWYLVASDRQSLATQFLKGTFSRCSSFPAPPTTTDQGDSFWRWWLFNKLVAIELDVRIFSEPKEEAGQRAWDCSLQLLRKYRSRLAANGVLLVVSALDLNLEAEQGFRLFGQNARVMVNELAKKLHLDLPVYLVVADCDKLPGFTAFVECLPENVIKQAVGIRFASPGKGANRERQQEELGKFFSRIHAVMLGQLREEKEFPRKKELFQFFQNWQACKAALENLAEILFEPNPAQAPLNWRGLYWVGGEEQPAFLDDLFNRFLPVDQPLARRV